VSGQGHAPAALPPVKTRYPLYRRLGINKITSNNFNVQRDSERTENFKNDKLKKILFFSPRAKIWGEEIRGSSKTCFTLDVQMIVME